MAQKEIPNVGWSLNGVCPECDRATRLALFFAGGRMPEAGAIRLQARCEGCGHVWDLPQVGAIRLGGPEPKRGRRQSGARGD